jgi:hypothetical protein
MKLTLKTELTVTLITIFAFTALLAWAHGYGIAFTGPLLNKWVISLFYCIGSAELIHIKMKAAKCKSGHATNETKDQLSS